jgi:hypothetical protein
MIWAGGKENTLALSFHVLLNVDQSSDFVKYFQFLKLLKVCQISKKDLDPCVKIVV